MSEGSWAAHRPSHRTLLSPRGPRTNHPLRAIVVSAARPAENLLPSMELAAVMRTPLVVLCSGATSVVEAADLADKVVALDCALIDVRDYTATSVLDFDTDGWRGAEVPRLGDLNRKRNLALLLAHHCRWESILLLDDDIHDINRHFVRIAAETLRSGGATGMLVKEYPDNSVVCHARALIGKPQEVFVTGAALVVDTMNVDSFFPEVYNEDWLFLHDRVRAGRVAAVGTVRQETYLPYEDVGRAATEEFGDTLAEGLMSLMHAGAPVDVARQASWWEAVLRERGEMLDRLVGGLCRHPDAAFALAAVEAARDQHHRFDTESFVRYVECWRADLATWRSRMSTLNRAGSFEAALDRLGLQGASATLLGTA